MSELDHSLMTLYCNTELLKEALRPILIIETTESIRVGEDNKKKEKEKETRQICPTPVCVVCLGLGNITDSSKSRDQYAYLQDLITDLKDAVSFDLSLLSANSDLESCFTF